MIEGRRGHENSRIPTFLPAVRLCMKSHLRLVHGQDSVTYSRQVFFVDSPWYCYLSTLSGNMFRRILLACKASSLSIIVLISQVRAVPAGRNDDWQVGQPPVPENLKNNIWDQHAPWHGDAFRNALIRPIPVGPTSRTTQASRIGFRRVPYANLMPNYVVNAEHRAGSSSANPQAVQAFTEAPQSSHSQASAVQVAQLYSHPQDIAAQVAQRLAAALNNPHQLSEHEVAEWEQTMRRVLGSPRIRFSPLPEHMGKGAGIVQVEDGHAVFGYHPAVTSPSEVVSGSYEGQSHFLTKFKHIRTASIRDIPTKSRNERVFVHFNSYHNLDFLNREYFLNRLHFLPVNSATIKKSEKSQRSTRSFTIVATSTFCHP